MVSAKRLNDRIDWIDVSLMFRVVPSVENKSVYDPTFNETLEDATSSSSLLKTFVRGHHKSIISNLYQYDITIHYVHPREHPFNV